MKTIFTTDYPKGGNNKMWEPFHIKASTGINTGMTIQGKTWTRDGCQLILLDEDQKEMANYRYDYHDFGPSYYPRMARDIAQDMNIIFELQNSKTRIEPEQLTPIMKEVLSKCESRYGNRIPDSDYEVLVSFGN